MRLETLIEDKYLDSSSFWVSCLIELGQAILWSNSSRQYLNQQCHPPLLRPNWGAHRPRRWLLFKLMLKYGGGDFTQTNKLGAGLYVPSSGLLSTALWCFTLYTYISIPLSLYIYIYIYICAHYIYIMYTLYIYIYICFSLSLSISLSLYIYIYRCICVYIYIYTHIIDFWELRVPVSRASLRRRYSGLSPRNSEEDLEATTGLIVFYPRFFARSIPHVDRCSNPLPWDPLRSP